MLMAACACITKVWFPFFPDGDRQKTERHNRSGPAVPSSRGECQDARKFLKRFF